MDKQQALDIIKHALIAVDNGQLDRRVHSQEYHELCYDAQVALYDQDGFRHMPDHIFNHIGFDCVSVYSIALDLKYLA
jgi:hypothetical protein